MSHGKKKSRSDMYNKFSTARTPQQAAVSALQTRVVSNRTAPLGTGRGSATAQSMIVYTLTNGTGGTLNFVIGDALGAIASRSGRTLTNPTAVSGGISVAIQKEQLAFRPMEIVGLNIQTSSDPNQFAQGFERATVDQYGQYSSRLFAIAGFASPSDYDNLIRPVDVGQFNDPLVLSDTQALIIPVIAGETVTLSISVGANVVGR